MSSQRKFVKPVNRASLGSIQLVATAPTPEQQKEPVIQLKTELKEDDFKSPVRVQHVAGGSCFSPVSMTEHREICQQMKFATAIKPMTKDIPKRLILSEKNEQEDSISDASHPVMLPDP